MSIVGIASGLEEESYCARLYYCSSGMHSWKVYFTITWDLELHLAVSIQVIVWILESHMAVSRILP